MKSLIFDATPLIYLTMAGLSKIFEELKGEKFTSQQVKIEVIDEEKRRGVPDIIILEKMFQNSIFNVKEPRDKSFRAPTGNKGITHHRRRSYSRGQRTRRNSHNRR